MTSPIVKPLGENESPGALSSMKFKSEARNDLSRTEHLDQIGDATANRDQNQNLSGLMSNTMEQATRPNQNNSLGNAIVGGDQISDNQNVQQPMSNSLVDNQFNSSVLGPENVGNGLLNQTDNQIVDNPANISQDDKQIASAGEGSKKDDLNQSATPNLAANTTQLEPNANDNHLQKTGIIGRKNPKLEGLGNQ